MDFHNHWALDIIIIFFEEIFSGPLEEKMTSFISPGSVIGPRKKFISRDHLWIFW